MITPTKQTPIPINSYFVTTSPKNKKAIREAKIGEVFCKNDNFDNDISFTAVLKRKNVMVPEIALIITNFH